MTAELRPFHETIIDAINECSNPSTGEIIHLFRLIKITKIPAGHDDIMVAIYRYFSFPGASKWAGDIREVKESLLAQKAEAEQQRQAQGAICLDELSNEAENLLHLLMDRHSTATWNDLLRERLEALHRIISQALGK